MKKVGLYCRVSCSGQTVKNQERELKAYCKRQDWQAVKLYKDEGISGTKSDRPALNKMLADARKGKFDILACWSVCRLGRSTVDLLNILTELQDLGIGFVATSQGIKTTDSAGRMLVSFLSAIAEFERDMIVSRVRSGLARAKAEGKTLGRPRASSIDMAKAIELRNQGLGYKRIAKILNVPKSTLYYQLEAVRKTQAV